MTEAKASGDTSVLGRCDLPRQGPVPYAASGGTPRPTLKTSDMNTVAERWSVLMAAYGPGDGSLDHSDEEAITIPEFLRGIAVLTSALDQLAEDLHRPA